MARRPAPHRTLYGILSGHAWAARCPFYRLVHVRQTHWNSSFAFRRFANIRKSCVRQIVQCLTRKRPAAGYSCVNLMPTKQPYHVRGYIHRNCQTNFMFACIGVSWERGAEKYYVIADPVWVKWVWSVDRTTCTAMCMEYGSGCRRTTFRGTVHHQNSV